METILVEHIVKKLVILNFLFQLSSYTWYRGVQSVSHTNHSQAKSFCREEKKRKEKEESSLQKIFQPKLSFLPFFYLQKIYSER